MEFCKKCGEKSVITDSSDFRACSSCGADHSGDVFQDQIFDSDGRALGSIIRVGDFGYRESKVYYATCFISEIVGRLALPDARVADISRLVSDVTEGEYGGGDWFPILVVACAYIVMRKSRRPLPMAEVAAAVGSDAHEVGRMVKRVQGYLKLDPLPTFDMAHSLERALKTCPSLVRVDVDKVEQMLKQGKFLLNCSVRWFLSTGRQPLPLIAAILAFVADVNGVSVTVEEIAKETHAVVSTSKLRKKELIQILIRASKALLPWGEDITVKNIAHNAPLLLRYMELKSRSGSIDLGTFGVGFQGLGNEKDSMYFDSCDNNESVGKKHENLENFKLSSNGLSNAYQHAIQRCNDVKITSSYEKSSRKKRKLGGMVIDARMSETTKEDLNLDQILEMNVGYDALPPSYITGLEVVKRRRKRIETAKIRIAGIMNPSSNSSLKHDKASFAFQDLTQRKRRKFKLEADVSIDWEDYIIEILLLRGVKEEEIEKGHYNRLLELHMFGAFEIK